MITRLGFLRLSAALPLFLAARVWAGEVEVTPFFGLQYGGYLDYPSGQRVGMEPGMQYGGAVDVGFTGSWSVEVLFARQETEAAGSPRVGLAVERYLAGVREEKDVGRARFLGVALLGLTRLVPEGLGGADEFFTVALGLGVRTSLSRRFGLRADVRAYYAVVSSGGATGCVNGNCLLLFGGSGIWQGDVTAGLVVAF